MRHFARISDEVANILAVKNIHESGIPYIAPGKNTVNYDLNTKYFPYWDYAPELYLRYPFFLVSTYIPYSWMAWSSFAYFLLFSLIIFIGMIRKNSSVRRYAVPISYFILLLSISNWTSSAFHYVRYFPFIILSISICHFFAVTRYLKKTKNVISNYIIILIIAGIPILFHQISVIYLMFWFLFLTISILVKFIKKEFTLKNKRWVFTSLILILIPVIFLLYRHSNRINLSGFNFDMTLQAFRYFFAESSNMYLDLILALMVILFVSSLRVPFKKEFFISIGALVFCLLLVSVEDSPIHPANRYLLFLYPICISIVALIFTSIHTSIGFFLKGSKKTNIVQITVFILLISLFFKAQQFDRTEKINNKISKTYNINKMRDINRINVTNYDEEVAFIGGFIEKRDIKIIKKILKDDRTVILCDDALFCFYHFPNNRSYIFRDYDNDISENIKNDSIFFLGKDNYVKNIYGETYVGKKGPFCRVLMEHPLQKVFFYDVSLSRIDDELGQLIAKNFSYFKEYREPISSKDLYKRLCLPVKTKIYSSKLALMR